MTCPEVYNVSQHGLGGLGSMWRCSILLEGDLVFSRVGLLNPWEDMLLEQPLVYSSCDLEALWTKMDGQRQSPKGPYLPVGASSWPQT